MNNSGHDGLRFIRYSRYPTYFCRSLAMSDKPECTVMAFVYFSGHIKMLQLVTYGKFRYNKRTKSRQVIVGRTTN